MPDEHPPKLFLIELEDEIGKIDFKVTEFEYGMFPLYIDLFSQRNNMNYDEAELAVKLMLLRTARKAFKKGKYIIKVGDNKGETVDITNMNDALGQVFSDQVYKFGGRAFVLGYTLSFIDSKETGKFSNAAVTGVGPNGEETTYSKYGIFKQKNKKEIEML